MPIYEYMCGACGKRASIFFRSFSVVAQPVCPTCQSQQMERIISKVAVLKTHQQRMDRLDDIERAGLSRLDDWRDLRQVERWAKRIGAEYDDELGTNFREMADQLSSEDRHPDLYFPQSTFQAALDRKYREMAGTPTTEDMFDAYIREHNISAPNINGPVE